MADATKPIQGKGAKSTDGKHNYDKYVKKYMDKLFKNNYDRKEAWYVLAGSVIIALNTGFINGVTMSPFFLSMSDSDVSTDTKINPSTQGVSGTGGSFTKSARYLVANDWPNYSYITLLIFAYIGGAFLVGIIIPKAHKHILEPKYGPIFFVAAIFLLCSSLFATNDLPSRFIFYFATAALGVQNGIASFYSENLIRCTLTGTSTDLGLIFAQALRGEYKKFIRGTLIAVIVSNYFIGGIIAQPIVQALNQRSLYVSVGLFTLLGCLCLSFTVIELGVGIKDALLGTWDWSHVLEVLFEDDDGEHTKEEFMQIFTDLDTDKSGFIDIEELKDGLEKSKKINLTDFRLKALMRAADADSDDMISDGEWAALADLIVNTTKDA